MAEVKKLGEGTWSFEDGFVRFFLLEGKEKAVLIDSGMNCPDAKEQAQKITDKPIFLLNTHGDGDHTSGTAAFDEIYMHPDDHTGCEVDQRYPETKLAKLEDGQEFDLGDRPLKIIHIPGHTAGSVAILDVKNRTLIAGDSVQKGHIFMFGAKRIPSKYESSLDKLIAINTQYDRILASHDEAVLPRDYVGKVKEAWRKVMNGEVGFEMVDMFGNQVKSYTTDVCGFFLE